jgi:hypothetical protein
MSSLPKNLLDLIEALEVSLDGEFFTFVSDEIDELLEQPIGRRAQLAALRDIMCKLGTATPILANSTCDQIDQVKAAIEIHLRTTFDA